MKLNLGAILQGSADARPDHPAIRLNERTVTYAELDRAARGVATSLRARGLAPGDTVALMIPNVPEFSIAYFGILYAGCTVVPLNVLLSAPEVAYHLEDSGAKLLVAHSLFGEPASGGAAEAGVPVVSADGEGDDSVAGLAAAEPLAALHPTDATDTAVILYTSGTTGKPKGAVRDSVGDPEQMQRTIEVYGVRPDDVYMTTGPLYHSGPSGFMGVASILGMTVVLQKKFDAEDYLRLVDRHGVSFTFSAPAPMRMVCNLPAETMAKYDRSSMRVLIANAAPWSYALKMLYLEHFPEESLFEVYGSTELGVNTILRPEHQRSKKGSCGQAAPGVEIALFTEDGERVTATGEEGELFVRSASVFSTYHKAQEKFEADRREGGWQTVGDIAYFDEDGFYYICDRKKDMIISGGVNIYPAEIEAALEHHDDVVDVAVFGIPNEEWGEAVHAHVVLRAGSALGVDDVIAYGREHLAGYKVPRSIEFVDEIPRTGTGKILKRELRKPYWAGHASRVV